MFDRFVFRLTFSVLFLFSATFAAAQDYPKAVASQKMVDADVEFLTGGVEGIGQAGVPGPLCVFGNNAAPVITGNLGNQSAAVLAAAKHGKGRVVAFGHGGYLSPDMLSKPGGSERLTQNILRWLANDNKKARIAVVDNPKLAEFLGKFGYEIKALKNLDDPEAKGKFQVLVMDAARLSENQIPRIEKFISGGGGFLTASLGWGWLQVSGKHDLKTEHTGNLLLAPMGIVWMDGYFDAPAKKDGENFFPATPGGPSPLLNVSKAIQAVRDHEADKKKLDAAELALATNTISLGLRGIPDKQNSVFTPFAALLKKEIVPSPKNKIRKDTMTSEVLAITLQIEEYLKKQRASGFPKNGIPALAAGSDFPGSVPTDAKTVDKTVEIDTKIPDWHSVGLYAAPGATVTVRVPKEFASPDGKKALGIRIGCHRDGIWRANDWSRYPEITIEVPLRGEETKIANPFGGLVYITVPRNFNKGTISVKISGCVPSPLYVHGKTSLEEWKESIRNAPGPWGELASDRVVLSLPSKHLRELDDPDKTMEFWDKVLDACADLCGRPIERDRPERMVCDRQISAGYMHSGYPVMTHMDVEKTFVDLYTHPKDGWGFYHEFGHNHQSGDWTFGGTTEVTVNLFTLYVYETVAGIKRDEARRESTPEWSKKKREEFFADGSPFDKWKSDPFLALIMYSDMIDAFGWDAFKNVFREYRELKNEERPKNDDEKRDQWMVRMSRQVEKNLGPYFDQWGVPVSQSAKDSIKDLPEWKPY